MRHHTLTERRAREAAEQLERARADRRRRAFGLRVTRGGSLIDQHGGELAELERRARTFAELEAIVWGAK